MNTRFKDIFPSTLKKTEFQHEDEIQYHLVHNPHILFPDGNSDVTVLTFRSRLSKSNGGYMPDLLLADSDGRIIVVEVKKLPSKETSRQIVGQALDYAAELSKYSYGKLDDLLKGALSEKLVTLVGNAKFDSVHRQCESNLEKGQIHTIIATDHANNDLINKMQYLDRHLDATATIVRVNKFNNGEIYTSLTIDKNYQNSGPSNLPRFYNVFKEDDPDNKNWRVYGSGNYFEIRDVTRPENVFYSVTIGKNEAVLELRIDVKSEEEYNDFKRLADMLADLGGKPMLGVNASWVETFPEHSFSQWKLGINIGNHQKKYSIGVYLDWLIDRTRYTIHSYFSDQLDAECERFLKGIFSTDEQIENCKIKREDQDAEKIISVVT